jgi:uncharacterized membrane protein
MKNILNILADKITKFVGSWIFIIMQSTILIIWMIINIRNIVSFDPYPFILLNLFLSFQAAYATPIILMSSGRQNENDRKQVEKDLELDIETNILLKEMSTLLNKINEDIIIDKQMLSDNKKFANDHNILLKKIEDICQKLDNLKK